MRRVYLLVPLLLFLALAALLFFRLGSGDPSVVPSALLGREAPALQLPPLDGANVPAIDPASFKGNVTVVNVWASWCAPCRAEHPLLEKLSKDTRIRITGINYKDRPANALRFLKEYKNPFAAIGVDEAGRAAIEWGVYGVPETFLVGRDGRIRYKQVGPLTAENMPRLLAEIEKALAAN